MVSYTLQSVVPETLSCALKGLCMSQSIQLLKKQDARCENFIPRVCVFQQARVARLRTVSRWMTCSIVLSHVDDLNI